VDRSSAWAWTTSGVVGEREIDGSRESVWVNPDLPPLADRARRPLRVEVLCFFEDTAALNAALEILHDGFAADTSLAAILRSDDSTRLLLYSAAGESAVESRYRAFRSSLRPTAIGVTLGSDPSWKALEALAPSAAAPAAPGPHP